MIAQIPAVNIAAPPEPACSFCNAPESEAKILIISLVDKNKFICGDCVAQVTEYIANVNAVPA